MGCGDWNDGMNLVGEKGKGESVWLAFFLFDVLKHFSEFWPDDAATKFLPSVCETQAKTCKRTSKKMRGTASGIAARISTMANRSAPRPIPNVRLIRCRKAGRSFPARAAAIAFTPRWTPWRIALFAANQN